MKDIATTFILAALMLVCFFGGLVVGWNDKDQSARREIQIQAVKAGYARWIVTDDGKTVFQWIPRVER